jgi:hypothetical protein
VRGLFLALPGEDLPLMRANVANGIGPSNQDLDQHMEEYQQAVNRRLHSASVLPARHSRWRRSRVGTTSPRIMAPRSPRPSDP